MSYPQRVYVTPTAEMMSIDDVFSPADGLLVIQLTDNETGTTEVLHISVWERQRSVVVPARIYPEAKLPDSLNPTANS